MSGVCDAKDSEKGHAMAFPHSYILEIIVSQLCPRSIRSNLILAFVSYSIYTLVNMVDKIFYLS